MKDFWISSGHHLLDRGTDGGLHVTDEFLKLYLARPELIPPAEACAVERTLHAALLADPRMPVSASDIDAIADADARENWKLMIAFRDRLLRHKTLEAAFRELVRGGFGNVPPLFINQLVHVILRNALDGTEDACGAARRRAFLPHAACHLARGIVDRGGRRNHRRRQHHAGYAFGFHAGNSRRV